MDRNHIIISVTTAVVGGGGNATVVSIVSRIHDQSSRIIDPIFSH